MTQRTALRTQRALAIMVAVGALAAAPMAQAEDKPATDGAKTSQAKKSDNPCGPSNPCGPKRRKKQD